MGLFEVNQLRVYPINASINSHRIHQEARKLNTIFADRKQYYLKYLSVLQRDADQLKREEEKEKRALQKGVNFSDPQYSSLPLNFDSSNPLTCKSIAIQQHKK